MLKVSKNFSLMFLVLVVFLFFGCSNVQKIESKEKDKPTQKIPASSPRHQYSVSLSQGIDFTKEGYPDFLISVSGMSGREDWGRWTDANLALAAKFVFKKPLPKKFTLELKAVAFGPNVGQPVKIVAGGVERAFTVKGGSAQEFHIEFDNVKGNTIEIVPPKPTAPKDVGLNEDTRKLGVGLIYMKIVE